MNIDKKLELLKQIKAVDEPPFLLTRIRQQIQNAGTVAAPVKWKWAFGTVAVIVLLLNVSILFSVTSVKQINEGVINENTGIEKVVSSMNLNSSNALYHE